MQMFIATEHESFEKQKTKTTNNTQEMTEGTKLLSKKQIRTTKKPYGNYGKHKTFKQTTELIKREETTEGTKAQKTAKTINL